MQVMIHAPWFILTVDEMDPESGIKLSHTWCIALERDLLEVLTALDRRNVRGLVCMLPAWSSPSGQWCSREIHEVWLGKSGEVRSLLLRDRDGHVVASGALDQRQPEAEMRLVLRIRSKKRRAKNGSKASKGSP